MAEPTTTTVPNNEDVLETDGSVSTEQAVLAEHAVDRAESPLRSRISALVGSKYFDSVILVIIVLNTITLGIEVTSFGAGGVGSFLRALEWVFVTIYVVEASLKLIAYRGKYFSSGWNIFDFIIVISCLIPTGGIFATARIIRVFRVLRAFRTIGAVRPLRRIVATILEALPGIGWAAILLVLLYYVFSIMGIHLFASEFPERFGTFGGAFETLFELTTLEGWQDIVRPIAEVYPAAWVYFLVVMFVTAFVLLNLIVGIVVDATAEMAVKEAADDAAQGQDERAQSNAEPPALEAELTALREQLSHVLQLLEAQQASSETTAEGPRVGA